MIFPQYNYKNFHNKNKSEWSLQVHKNTISLIEQTRGLIEQAKMYIRNGGFYSSNANSMISQHKESLKFYCSKLNFR